jgi:hypothetical protein
MDEGPSVLLLERSRARRSAVPWLLFVLLLSGARSASAEEQAPPATTVPADAGELGQAAKPESEVPGAKLYTQAESHYVAGDVTGALALMQESYAASGRPELLFNLGQLHRELHHCREARESYDRYLALVPKGARREEVERSRRELEHECPSGSPADASPVATEPERIKPYWTPVRIAAWSTIGASAVLGATAGYFALHAHHLQTEFENDIQHAKSTGAYVAAYNETASDGQHAAVVARGLTVAAVGVAAIGVSLLVFNPGGHPVNAVSLRCNSDGARAIYQGTF